MKRIITFVIIVPIVGVSSNVLAGKWRSFSFTTKDGLVGKYAYSIAVDSKGNMWIGINKELSKVSSHQWGEMYLLCLYLQYHPTKTKCFP
jgi:hypothetical protein